MGKRKANARLRHACNTLLMGILVCIVGVFGARMLESGAPSSGLGTQIVMTLVSSELGGSIHWSSVKPHGTLVTIEILLSG